MNDIQHWDDIPKIKTRKLKKFSEITEFLRHKTQEFTVVKSLTVLDKISNRISSDLDSNMPITPVNDIYNLVCDPAMLIIAFRKLSKNKGATTEGSSFIDTVDDISIEKIYQISSDLSNQTFKWSTIRRIYIPKPGKKKLRPLGLPNFSDKIVQEVIRLILNAIYEPEFKKHECNSGFRPSRDCNHAIRNIKLKGQFADFAIEGDIEGAYDNVQHDILLEILSKRINDKKFLKLISNGLKCGILDDHHFKDTFIGVPQGGIASPIIFNIYMQEFDKFIINDLIPRYKTRPKESTKLTEVSSEWYKITSQQKRYKEHLKDPNYFNSKSRFPNFPVMFEVIKRNIRHFTNIPFTKEIDLVEKYIATDPKGGNAYSKYTMQIRRKFSDEQYKILDKFHREYIEEQLKNISKVKLETPYLDQEIKEFNAYYHRYADDWILLIRGNEETTKKIKNEISDFLLTTLKLKLSPEKTLITNLTETQAKFLGFTIYFPRNTLITRNKTSGNLVKRRPIQIGIDVSRLESRFVIKKYMDAKYQKPREVGFLTILDDYQIITKFNQFMMGLGNYYCGEVDHVYKLNRWHYILYYSCLKTLATKYRISVREVISKYGFRDISVPGILDSKKPSATDLRICCKYSFNEKEKWVTLINYKEFTYRLYEQNKKYKQDILEGKNNLTPVVDFITLSKVNLRTSAKLGSYCFICGSEDKIENHHIKPIRNKTSKWTGFKGFDKVVASLGRKQIPVCHQCHKSIHAGTYDGASLDQLYDYRLVVIENFIRPETYSGEQSTNKEPNLLTNRYNIVISEELRTYLHRGLYKYLQSKSYDN